MAFASHKMRRKEGIRLHRRDCDVNGRIFVEVHLSVDY